MKSRSGHGEKVTRTLAHVIEELAEAEHQVEALAGETGPHVVAAEVAMLQLEIEASDILAEVADANRAEFQRTGAEILERQRRDLELYREALAGEREAHEHAEEFRRQALELRARLAAKLTGGTVVTLPAREDSDGPLVH